MKNANKHIAMWSCPRSRSTAITRSFEQLDECIVYDEPLLSPYLIKQAHGYYPPIVLEEFLKKSPELDYNQIIKKLTGNLPFGVSFSFQKHMSKHLVPEFDRCWLRKVNNFFIIRNPKSIILSYWKANKWNLPNMESVGLDAHYHLFKEIEQLTGAVPLVIDADELAKQPQKYLKFICEQLELDFSQKMLHWDANPQKTSLQWTEKDSCFNFYSQVINSTGFQYRESEKIELPKNLVSLHEKCLPFYEKMLESAVLL